MASIVRRITALLTPGQFYLLLLGLMSYFQPSCQTRSGKYDNPDPSVDLNPNSVERIMVPPVCGQSGNLISIRIVGGGEAELDAWPWMAAIYATERTGRQLICGGSLITSRDVITAAHCMLGRRRVPRPARTLTVRLGELDLSSDDDGADPIDMKVSDIVIYPSFNARNYQNDIAIIRLLGSAPHSHSIRPICLPRPAHVGNSFAGLIPYITGWGSTVPDGQTNSFVLQQVMLQILSNEDCQKMYGNVQISHKQMCAAIPGGGKDACQGDSGGPMMIRDTHNKYRWMIVGIVSFGAGCAEPDKPGVYTRITEYLDWITTTVGKL